MQIILPADAQKVWLRNTESFNRRNQPAVASAFSRLEASEIQTIGKIMEPGTGGDSSIFGSNEGSSEASNAVKKKFTITNINSKTDRVEENSIFNYRDSFFKRDKCEYTPFTNRVRIGQTKGRRLCGS